MPAVDIPEVGTVEFPDSMSEEEIKSTIKRKFYSEPTQKVPAHPVPFVPDTSSNLPPRELPPAKPYQDKTDYAGESLLGISPEDVPSGAGTTMPAVTIPLSAAAKTAASVVQYGTSPRGIGMIAGTATPAAPAVYAKWAYDMLKGGYESAKDAGGVIASMIRDHINNQMAPQAGEKKQPVDQEQVQRLAEDAINTALQFLGGVTSLHHTKVAAEQIRQVAPATAAALIEQAKEGSDALHSQAEKVLQPVRKQPGEGAREVPSQGAGPEAGPRSEPVSPEKTEALSDYGRYQELREQMRGKTPEQMAELGKEMIDIQRRHGGFPPKAPEAPTVTETTPKAELAPTPTVANARPAIRLVGGEVVTGEAGQTHVDIISAKGLKAEDIDQRGFVSDNGDFLDREQAAEQTGLSTQKEPQRLHSTDLPEAQLGGGAAEAGEIPETGVGGEKYGVAERVREERAKAGQVGPVEPGEGINTPDSIGRGRAMLQADPGSAEKLMSEFEADKKLSSDAMAVARAQGEALAAKARTIEERFGTDSPEYRAARDELTAWDKRSKVMQTEWHKTGMAQQGETDIDTGSFTGLEREYSRDSGKTFTPAQGEKATRIAKGVRDAEAAAGKAEKALADEITKGLPKGPKVGDAEQKALDAASKAVRENAVRLAKADEAARKAKTANARDVASIQQNAARKALESAQKQARDAAAALAKKERTLQANPELKVWEQARVYLEKGEGSFDDIRNKIATDLGMSVKKVTSLLSYTKKLKSLADDVWKKRQLERTLKMQAKRWIRDQSVPFLQRTFQKLPRLLFGLKVFGHGTVALGTHAPMLAFQPKFWPEYARNFAAMYGMVFKPAYHERLMQDLVRKPNYITAQRAGLQNNPFQFEEYVDPSMNVLVRKLTSGGSRGYSVLRLLRQDVFDHMWDNLPKSQQIPEIAQALADSINHVTGVTKKGAPQGTHILLFAPRLEASRVAWLAVDPAKSMLTLMNWKNASFGERTFAINQLKEKATVAATMGTLLGLNQAILSYTGSKQQVNFTNPLESDFLKFKAGGMNISYGNPMLSMARLPMRLWEIGSSDGGKLKNVVYPDERAGTALFDYLRSQESPFASIVTDLVLRADPTGRPLPHSNQPVPARLRRRGIEPYTWPEFLTEQLSPIPLQEAIKEVWGDQFGMSEQQQKALATMLFMWGTGGRMSEDLSVEHSP